MAVRVKDLSASATKYQQRATSAAAEYANNAVLAAEEWLANTVASKQTWKASMVAAGIEDRFERGARNAGSAKYSNRLQAVGQGRYTEGVGQAGDAWRAGFEPFAQTIAGLTLPGRRPRGDPANYARVQSVGTALSAKRLAMLGAGS